MTSEELLARKMGGRVRGEGAGVGGLRSWDVVKGPCGTGESVMLGS